MDFPLRSPGGVSDSTYDPQRLKIFWESICSLGSGGPTLNLKKTSTTDKRNELLESNWRVKGGYYPGSSWVFQENKAVSVCAVLIKTP